MKKVSRALGALAALSFVLGIGVSSPAGAAQHSVEHVQPLDTGWN